MKKEEGVRCSFNPLAKITFIKTRQLKSKNKEGVKKEGKSSSHSSDSTPLPLHKANEEKEILETGNKEKRENNV